MNETLLQNLAKSMLRLNEIVDGYDLKGLHVNNQIIVKILHNLKHSMNDAAKPLELHRQR